jgi:hypothetical protein
MRGGAVAARRAHNPEVLGSNPSPATYLKSAEKSGGFFVNSRAMFTTHSRVMFTSDDRVGVYHFKESFALLLLITPPFFGRVAGNFHLE